MTLLIHTKLQKQCRLWILEIRRLWAPTKMTDEHIAELQYAEACTFMAHSLGALQSMLTAAHNYLMLGWIFL